MLNEQTLSKCKLPESVINFKKNTECSNLFIEALVVLAARKTNDIAIFTLGGSYRENIYSIFSTFVFTSKYAVAKEYFEQVIEEQRYIALNLFNEGTYEYNKVKNSIDMWIFVEGNKLGEDFYAKFIDFSYKRFIKNNKITIDICKKKINEKVQAYINYEKKYGKGETDFHFMGYSYDSDEEVREATLNKILQIHYEEHVYSQFCDGCNLASFERCNIPNKSHIESSHPEEFKAMNAFEKDGIDYVQIYYILKFGKYGPEDYYGRYIHYVKLNNDELNELIKDILD